MAKLPFKRAKRKRIVEKAIVDINKIIDDLHKMPVEFTRGSVYQRIITDLDGARVTARAIRDLEIDPNVNATSHNTY